MERNLFVFVHHILELVANPKATPTHVDAVYSRKCVIFIMHATVGRMLGEKAQVTGRKIIYLFDLVTLSIILSNICHMPHATCHMPHGFYL